MEVGSNICLDKSRGSNFPMAAPVSAPAGKFHTQDTLLPLLISLQLHLDREAARPDSQSFRD